MRLTMDDFEGVVTRFDVNEDQNPFGCEIMDNKPLPDDAIRSIQYYYGFFALPLETISYSRDKSVH